MGWTCQYDFKSFCKRVQQPCIPGMNGCILKTSEYTFSSGSYEQDKKNQQDKETSQIDFAELAKSN